jgi:hypothetical protein
VHFTLCPPLDLELARRLRDRLQGTTLREVLISPPGRTAVAMAAARFFEQVVGHSNMTVVLDGGLTIGEMVDGLKPGLFEGVTIAPIASDPPSYDVGAYELMTRLSVKYPVRVRCLKPPLRLDPVLEADHEAVRRAAADADVVLMGRGHCAPASAPSNSCGISPGLDRIRATYLRIACRAAITRWTSTAARCACRSWRSACAHAASRGPENAGRRRSLRSILVAPAPRKPVLWPALSKPGCVTRSSPTATWLSNSCTASLMSHEPP